MIYASCSLKEVLGRVVRNTRIQDASYLNDAEEWIPEAMGMMKTHVLLQKCYKDVVIENHRGRLPCAIRTLKAVQYGGCRLRYYSGARTATSPAVAQPTENLFQGTVVQRETPSDNYIFETSIESVFTLASSSAWYYTELDWINTSFSCGVVRLFFTQMPLDELGYPLIPDNENYKEALYWYVRGKMIGSGFKDPAYNIQYCDMKWEMHAVRARAEIRYQSIDQMQESVEALSRLILPMNYWEDFSSVQGQEQMVGTPVTQVIPESGSWKQTQW